MHFIPPPSTMIPVFFANTVSEFIALMSATMSTIKPGFLNEWNHNISPMEPSVNAGQNTGILF